MTKKNPYENQEDTLDIPDFVEEKTSTDSETVDMSIFKMSDEELYDDAQEEETEEVERKPAKKKGNGLLIFSLIVNLLLLAACAGAVFYALNQHSAYVKANTENQQVKAAQEVLKQQIAEKDATIEALNKQIEDSSKAPVTGAAGTYKIGDGAITFRVSPSREADKTTYDGEEYAYPGEEFPVMEVVKGTDDSTYSWAKVADNVYFCLGTADDVWAEKIN
ncbi:MAG: hypothetical protein II577_05830 [Erysipelotrichaceae bacterium]|nr:hypothetical protein [Erysipelotrichaceae bacterium]